MKRLLTLALCAASLVAAVSCVKDRPKDNTIKAKSYQYFEAAASTAELPAEAGTVLLTVNANVPWTLTADKGLTPSVTKGSGDAVVEIAVPENSSFSARSFSWSVSTDAELDVEDPEQWTVWGRTLDFSVEQAGMVPKLSVDASEVKVSAMAVSAEVILTANVGYTVECKSTGLTCSVTEDPESPIRYHLNFSFPANETEEAVEYRAEVIPTETDIPGVVPVEIVIRQGALVSVFINFAGEFTPAIPTSATTLSDEGATHTFTYQGSTYSICAFPPQSGTKYYIVSTTGGKCLRFNDTGSCLQLPSIPGKKLASLEILVITTSAGKPMSVSATKGSSAGEIVPNTSFLAGKYTSAAAHATTDSPLYLYMHSKNTQIRAMTLYFE